MNKKKPKKSSRVYKERYYAYIVLHEGVLYSLQSYCQKTKTAYKTILMRIARWHSDVPNEYLLFDTALADDREILSREHFPIGTPKKEEKERRKHAADQRIRRSSHAQALQLLRDFGNPEDNGESHDGRDLSATLAGWGVGGGEPLP